MKRITIVFQKNAMTFIPKVMNRTCSCFYLTDDYQFFTKLCERFARKINIKNLSSLFQETYQEIKKPTVELISTLNKKHDSLEWWSGPLATNNVASIPLVLNLTYLFCAKKILSRSESNIIVIVDSQALSDCIANIAIKAGYKVSIYRNGINRYIGKIRTSLFGAATIFLFFWKAIQRRRAAFKYIRPLRAKKTQAKKRIAIRSWITQDTFDESGKFKDRNFGILPEWLRNRSYEVWTVPMCFNLRSSINQVHTLMKNDEHEFLIPDHYLEYSDYLSVVIDALRLSGKRLQQLEIDNIDVTPLFDEILQRSLLDFPYEFNLCYLMLKRLQERQIEIDAFYYAFENNHTEKPFILGCRKFFPHSKIIGFQHTAFYLDQLGVHLGSEEKDYHPLPDKIVCSGPAYIKLFKEAGFPADILAAGPNLRFESVHVVNVDSGNISTGGKKRLVLPLSFSSELAFELLVKVKKAFQDSKNYQIYIRTHPLLKKDKLIDFLDTINMTHYEFADEGSIHEWFPKMHAMILTGSTITVLEAACVGLPVIRVIPDNTFHYDALVWAKYPLPPVNNALEIRHQLQTIQEILSQDQETFQKIGTQVLTAFFTKPSEQTLKMFI